MKLLNKIWPWSRFAADAREIAAAQRDLKFDSQLLAIGNENHQKLFSQLETLQQRIDHDAALIDKLERQRANASATSRKGWATRRAKALVFAKDIPLQPLLPREEVVAGVVAKRKNAKALS